MFALRRHLALAITAAAIAVAAIVVAPLLPAAAETKDTYVPPRAGTIYEYADLAVQRNMTRQIIDRIEAVNKDVLLVRQFVQGVERVGHRRSVRNLVTIDSGYESQRFGRAKIVLEGIDTAMVRALWPFKPGTKLTLAATVKYARAVTTKALEERLSPRARLSSVLTVERRAKVVVPAGSFDTVVITRADTVTGLKGENPKKRFYTIWYAPGPGIPVRIEFAVDRPDNLLSRRELKAIRNDKQ